MDFFHPDDDSILKSLRKIPQIPTTTPIAPRDKIETLFVRGLTPHELKVLVLIARKYAVVANFFSEFHYVPSCSKIALNPEDVLRRDPVGYLLSFLDSTPELPSGVFRWITPSEIEDKLSGCGCGAQHALIATSAHTPTTLEVWFTDPGGNGSNMRVSNTNDITMYVRSLSTACGWRWFSPHSTECCTSDEFISERQPSPVPLPSSNPAMDAIIFTGFISVQECVWLLSALALRSEFKPSLSLLPYPPPCEAEYLEFLQWNSSVLVAAAGGPIRASTLLVNLRHLVLDRGVSVHVITKYSPRVANRMMQLLGAHDVVTAFSNEPPATKTCGLTYQVVVMTDEVTTLHPLCKNTVPLLLAPAVDNPSLLLTGIRRNSTFIFPLTPFLFLNSLPLPSNVATN